MSNIEYFEFKGCHIMKANPAELNINTYRNGISTHNLPNNTINGTFYSEGEDDNGKYMYYCTSPLVVNGKVDGRWASNCTPKKQSALIVWKTGEITMQRIGSVSDVDLNKVKHIISGLGVLSPDYSYSFDTEWDKELDDIIRFTSRSLIGYKKSEDKMYLITTNPIWTSHTTQYDVIDLGRDLGLTYLLQMDGGGSAAFKTTEYKVKPSKVRTIHNTLSFSGGVDETKPIQPTEQEKIIIDIGHLGNDSGAVGNGFREVDLNNSIAKHTISELERHNIKVIVTTGTLANRVAIEKKEKPKYFISIHNNAGGGDGMEVISYSPNNLSKNILDAMVADGCNNSRGLKYNKDLYVLKNTSCTACIVECAFVDTKDIEAVDTEIEREKFGKAIAKGILKTLGTVYVEDKPIEPTEPSKEIWWRAVCGSFDNQQNAQARVRELQEKGYKDAFVVKFEK